MRRTSGGRGKVGDEQFGKIAKEGEGRRIKGYIEETEIKLTRHGTYSWD
jgi:hypothetical protein